MFPRCHTIDFYQNVFRKATTIINKGNKAAGAWGVCKQLCPTTNHAFLFWDHCDLDLFRPLTSSIKYQIFMLCWHLRGKKNKRLNAIKI